MANDGVRADIFPVISHHVFWFFNRYNLRPTLLSHSENTCAKERLPARALCISSRAFVRPQNGRVPTFYRMGANSPHTRHSWDGAETNIRLPSQGIDSPQIDISSDDDEIDSIDTAINGGGSPGTRVVAPLMAGHRRFPSADDDIRASDNESENGHVETEAEKPVTWASLPKKGQLAILTFARLSEPLTQTSLQAYMFYQLKSFDPSLPDSAISAQAGILQGSFTAAQFLTAVFWGRLADAPWMGRKRVLLIGLLGTSISCVGFGFSRSFMVAAIFRTLGGVLNSNVGVMRTLIAEIIAEKK